jgi:aromatic ring-opening dioxygenase LigB subunit
MSLVFTAITPHPPFLIPTVGKNSPELLEKTKIALKKLEEDLYLAKPDVLMVISPHGHLLSEAFTMNVSSEFTNDFKEFGDLSTRVRFKGDIELSSHIREHSKLRQQLPLVLLSEEVLDHGTVIPLLYLTQHLSQIRILPIGFCGLDWKTHVDFGYFLKEEIMKSTQRVAVIASGDLSHALDKTAPAGFNPQGQIFDETDCRDQNACFTSARPLGPAFIAEDLAHGHGPFDGPHLPGRHAGHHSSVDPRCGTCHCLDE